MADKTESSSEKFIRHYEKEGQFIEEWLTSHKELTTSIEITETFTIFLGVFAHKKAFSFDQLVVTLETSMATEDVFATLGLALTNKLLVYTDGVITLV
jgi:hypothetical protein